MSEHDEDYQQVEVCAQCGVVRPCFVHERLAIGPFMRVPLAPPVSTDAAVLRDLRVWLKFREDELTGAVVQANLDDRPAKRESYKYERLGIRSALAKLDALSSERGGRTPTETR